MSCSGRALEEPLGRRMVRTTAGDFLDGTASLEEVGAGLVQRIDALSRSGDRFGAIVFATAEGRVVYFGPTAAHSDEVGSYAHDERVCKIKLAAYDDALEA